ncbi:MAG: thioredoxin domain-containing protein [Candidatus Tectomicrobia bacterium]|nr:thioredoxin domain-containing protein [Candidatus Tectomicrobia bacterium]
MPAHRFTNHLAGETSPYLLQHAHNPVDWRPWGEEALAKAKREGKPILLSIGYSACHWCHVMEHESFENEEIAALMNEHFVNVKVDREERPDLDHIYQTVAQMITGGGGWPLTMFLTPQQQPFFAGTYFPPEDRYGRPGFPRLLLAIARHFREQPEDILQSVEQITAALQRQNTPLAAPGELGDDLLRSAAERLAQVFDSLHGGFGTQPKFPNPMSLEFFLRYAQVSGEERYLRMVLLALEKMAWGGIYDQLGGGFHRYAVDSHWLVPHFEKMLYDNALLIKLYLDAFQLTSDPELRRVAVESLEYVCREMLDAASGAFYSTQDADSEGEEGKFYVWTPRQVAELLDDEERQLFTRFYDVTEQGNFEHGASILHRTLTVEQLGKLFRIPTEDAEAVLARARAKLFAARRRRVWPGRDEKALTAWNGLMISACARAGSLLDEPRYLEIALRALRFIRETMLRDGLLLRTYKEGRAKLNAYLDDYAYVVGALLDAYEATGDGDLLSLASQLNETMIAQFHDADAGGFFFTGKDHEPLIVRTKSASDQAIPSGSSVAAQNLLRFHALTGEERFRSLAEGVFRLYREQFLQNPFGFGNMLCALHLYLDTPRQIVIVGGRDDAAVRSMLEVVRQRYLPNRWLVCLDPADPNGARLPAALAGKGQVDGKPTAYVCHRFACSAPVHSAAALARLLD